MLWALDQGHEVQAALGPYSWAGPHSLWPPFSNSQIGCQLIATLRNTLLLTDLMIAEVSSHIMLAPKELHKYFSKKT